MRRLVLLLSLLLLTTISVAAITQSDVDLHFGSALLITPLILFLAQGMVLESWEWRDRGCAFRTEQLWWWNFF